MMATKKQKGEPSAFNPSENYARFDGTIVTISPTGKRRTYRYRSGERLVGRPIRREDYML